eukprot:9371796-Alexandrium_andersonii.AAC.1
MGTCFGPHGWMGWDSYWPEDWESQMHMAAWSGGYGWEQGTWDPSCARGMHPRPPVGPPPPELCA